LQGPMQGTASVTLQPTCATPTGTIEVLSPLGNYMYSLDGNNFQSSTTFTGVAPGSTHYVYVEIGNGCESKSSSFYSIAGVPNAPATPVVTVQNDCGSSTLSTNATGSLLWSNTATGSSITVTDAATYSVTATAGGCTSAAGTGTSAPGSKPTITLSNFGDS